MMMIMMILTWVNDPGLSMTRAIWITTVVLEEGLNKTIFDFMYLTTQYVNTSSLALVTAKKTYWKLVIICFCFLKTFSIHHFSQQYLLNIGDNTKVCCQGVSCNFRSITFLQNPDCICFTVDLEYVDANVLLGVQMIWWRRFTLKLALGPQQVLQ